MVKVDVMGSTEKGIEKGKSKVWVMKRTVSSKQARKSKVVGEGNCQGTGESDKEKLQLQVELKGTHTKASTRTNDRAQRRSYFELQLLH